MEPTIYIGVGFLLIACAVLFYKYDQSQRAALSECQQRSARFERAQQARINYESLDKIDDGTSGVAVAMLRRAELEKLETAAHESRMKRLRELDELLSESIQSFSEARNPKSKGHKVS